MGERMIQSASDAKSACCQWLRAHEAKQVDLVKLTSDGPQHALDLLANKWAQVWQCHDGLRRKQKANAPSKFIPAMVLALSGRQVPHRADVQ